MDIQRNDLIAQLMERYGYTKQAATDIVRDFTDTVVDNLRGGNTVTLRGFGSFDILERKARSCPNPQTGERVEIPAHWIPRFYPGVKMRAAVKMWEDDERRGLA